MAGDLMGKAADWAFTKRFRRGGFDWRASRLASERIAEALAEIHAVARHDPLHAADGAVRLLVKLSPALEQVDSSSGALGSAARAAVDALVPVIAHAPADGIRAARDNVAKNPAFAAEVALAALYWICQGRGYELTSLDVQMAYRFATEAGLALGQSERVALRIQTMLKPMTREVRWVRERLNLPASSEAGRS